ncbi:PhzF family phenazine biosynthesis protein [Litoreibacter ponti]|uniref:PhzF family phenazine biosynthesis protein n=1 Tax=Litoreibacter ponti TaxID=1510457 RepID=A0A2T6BLV8_9RHOB|nr:PhzF family phenazine biosynthesis protein [Litoreibacter ponti]PTX57035.1 PhzF family phenazine biosynthesis protein [Litoreibacter ponti]
MAVYPFDWVDAFTDTAFGGNGCAVVYDDGALDTQTCLKFTRETGLVECTFIGPSDVADLRVRYFFPTHEIPFAGHPTIASVASALSRGRVSGASLTLETGAGVIPIEVSPEGWITMTQNAPIFGQSVPSELVAGTVGLSANDIVGAPQVVSTGLPFVVTVVRDHTALRRAKVDVAALTAFQEQVRLDGAPVMEPYLVSLGGATAAGDTFSRLLLLPPSPPEDPFTGSATGCAAAYLWHHGLIDTPAYVAQQGHDMGRPGEARVEVLGPRDAITGVRVSGQGRIVMRGEMLP